MGSKFIVPLELFDFNTTPTDISSSGYKSFYLKTGWLKKLTGTTETDLVLQRPLSTFSVLGPGATGPINTSSTVEEAFEKLQQSLYINLVGDVTGTAAYNAGNLEIVTTVVGGGSSVPLTATKFNTNHTTALGNPYLIDDIVYYSGHIYKALANNDAITPAIGGNAYWSDLGAGFPYRQNPVDWNATSGDYQILNKPTNVSSFTNDAGYLTTESDPVFTASAAYGITSTQITNWDTAFTQMNNAHLFTVDVYAMEDIPAGHVVKVVTGFAYYPSYGLPGVRNADNVSFGAPPDNVLGIAINTINSSNIGQVVCKGMAYGLDTHAASIGDYAWVGTAGDLTFTRPTAPQHATYIGVVAISDPTNGAIFVDVQNGFNLSHLHNVDASTPTDKDVLYFDSATNTWKSNSITNILGFTPGSGGGVKNGVASGTDTYAVAITGVTSYTDGDAYLVRFTNGNTTSATLNINSLGAIALYRNNDGPLIGGDIVAGAEMLCIYNSTTNAFQCIGTAPNTMLAYVTNAESITINRGQPVYVYSGQGDRITVKLAYNTSDATSAQTIGVVQSTSIAANQKGLVIIQGQLDNLNIFPTSTYADGNYLYLGSTPGTLTNVKPVAPNHMVYMGYVTTASNGSAGRMYVKVQNGYELDELHNVQATSPSNNDVLAYETGTPGQWKTKSIATVLGYTPVSAVNASTPLSSTGGSAPTISITQASGSTNGYLSSTDWTTFNNKQSTISLTTTGSSGAATLIGTILNIPNHTLAGLGGISLTSLTATTPLAYNNTTGAFSIQVANTSQSGYLSSTDWNTFNGKQNALSGSGIVKSTAGTISYIGGTSGQYIAGDGSLVTFPTIPTIGTWGALNYPTWTTGTPFVKMTAAGTFALDTNVYLTSINSSQVTTALGYTPVPNTRNLTINGVTQDLSADRTFNVTSPGFALANYYNFY